MRDFKPRMSGPARSPWSLLAALLVGQGALGGTLTPAVEVLLVANSSSPPSALALRARDLSAGPVFVKWRALDGASPTVGTVTLTYSTGDRDYRVLATGLQNGANGCTPDTRETAEDDGATGCAVLDASPVPPDVPFHLRVTVTNAAGRSGQASSVLLNTGAMRPLIGGADVGLEGQAARALFRPVESTNVYLDDGILAVTSKGDLFFRDPGVGLLHVSPVSGVVEVLLRRTGASTGDGGPARDATSRDLRRIALDAQDRLYVYDAGLIRRMDTRADPMTVDALAGGGSDSGDTPAALQAALPWSIGAWFVLPNGDHYFEEAPGESVATGYRIRVLRSSTGRFETLRPSGVGDSLDPGQDVAQCALSGLGAAYDPATSAISLLRVEVSHFTAACPRQPGTGAYAASVGLEPATGAVASRSVAPLPLWASLLTGLDGVLRAAQRERVFRYDAAAPGWVPIVGADPGVAGRQADGTPALQAALHLDDVFVARDGRQFLVDGTRIRTIDAQGKVQTVAGQTLASDVSGAASRARVHSVRSVGAWTAGAAGTRVVLMDVGTGKLSELAPGGTVRLLAGGMDGVAAGTDARTQALQVVSAGSPFDLFGVHASTGDVYFSQGGDSVSRLDRATGSWLHLVGGGAQPYSSPGTDGALGPDVDLTPLDTLYYLPLVLGMGSDRLLVAQGQWSGTMLDTVFNEHDLSNGRKRHVVGTQGAPNDDFCADGTLLTACPAPAYGLYRLLGASYLPSARRWAVARRAGKKVWSVAAGGTMATLADLPRQLESFVYEEATGQVHFCDDAGNLATWDAVQRTETPLALPAGMRCVGNSLALTRASLVFPYRYNGLSGVGEVPLPGRVFPEVPTGYACVSNAECVSNECGGPRQVCCENGVCPDPVDVPRRLQVACGCDASGGLAPLAVLLLLGRWRRSGRARPAA